MIDLKRFTKPIEAIVPIRDNKFVYNLKKYKLETEVEDDWYKVEIINNQVKVIESESYLALKGICGYTYNNFIIFQNYDVAKRKWGFNMQKPLNFNRSETFNAIRAIVWEDKEVYYMEPNYSDSQIFDIKEAYDEEKSLDGIKGITPELRNLYICHSIERDNLKALLAAKAKEEKQQEHEKRMREETPYRLRYTLEQAGAVLENYSISGSDIIIDWTIPGNPNKYNSRINANSWMVEEAGYCMSGQDKRHNLTSLVKTADDYEKDGLTYITRR